MSSSALCVSVLFPLVCILTLSSGVIVLYVTMSVASSLGLPQPPVAIQAASQSGPIPTTSAPGDPWAASLRPTFWNGVGTETVFEKDVAMKGRLFGAAAAGSLALVGTPTQTAGVETTYTRDGSTMATIAHNYSFDVGIPQSCPTYAGGASELANNLQLVRKRQVLGGTGYAAVASNDVIIQVGDITDSGGAAYTVALAPPVFQFMGSQQAGITNAIAAGVASNAITCYGYTQGSTVVLCTVLAAAGALAGPNGTCMPFVTSPAADQFQITCQGTYTNNVVVAWFVARLSTNGA